MEFIVHNLFHSSYLICEEEDFITPYAQVNPSFDPSNHEESPYLNVKSNLASGVLNAFIDTYNDYFTSSSVDLSKPLIFDDLSFDNS